MMQLQAYLGMINYYSRFLPNLATILGPMYEILRKDKKYEWSKECQESFEKTKAMLVTNNILVPFDPKKTCHISSGCKSLRVRRLSHEIEEVEKLIYFASTTLSQAQKNYVQVHKKH